MSKEVIGTFDNFGRSDYKYGSKLIQLVFYADGSVGWDFQLSPYKEE